MAEPNFLALMDDAPLNRRYWTSISLIVLVAIFDLFDFYIAGFLVSVVGPQWNLTYGQVSVMLLSAGAGAMLGAALFGALADRWGRKRALVAAVTLCAAGSGSIAFIPDGAWQAFAALRFLVGMGLAGATTSLIPLAVELTPLRVRTVMTSAMVVPTSFGALAAAALSAALLPVIGWRGLAAIGFAPLVLAIACAFLLQESVRWLVSRGRVDEARTVAARQLGRQESDLPDPPVPASPPRWRLADLYSSPRRFWLIILMWFGFSTASFGVLLWGPTVLTLVLGLSPAEAAKGFVLVSVAGLIGRIIFAVAPQKFGRVACGKATGFGMAVTLGAAALLADVSIGPVSLFLALVVVGAIFFDGGTVNLGPIASEVYPVRIAASANAVGQIVIGLGKITGPLWLALIAGADNYITPKATAEAITPAFLLFAACGLVVGLAFTFLGIETHRRRLPQDDET